MVRVVFVAPKSVERMSASTLLRSYQLCQLTRPLFDAAGIESIVTHRTGYRGAILIMNKYFLRRLEPHAIERLKWRGNLIIADPADGRFDDDLLACCDVLIAMSTAQLKDYARRFPELRVAYVGMHVDLRIPDVLPPQDRLRLAHFGELANAKFAEAVSDLVAFVNIDTNAAMNASWIYALSQHNAHYAIRAPQQRDGFKPFMKGIIAAHCGCPIMIDSKDEEARRFLPPDYPYFTESSSADEVRNAIDGMQKGFGGLEWRQALAIMRDVAAANSRECVARQLFEVISDEIGNVTARSIARRPFLGRVADQLRLRFGRGASKPSKGEA